MNKTSRGYDLSASNNMQQFIVSQVSLYRLQCYNFVQYIVGLPIKQTKFITEHTIKVLSTV